MRYLWWSLDIGLLSIEPGTAGEDEDALSIITLGIYSLFKIKVGVNNGLWLAETGQRAQYWPLIGWDLNTGLRRWRSWSQLMPNAINESISRIYLNCKQKLYHLSCYPVIIQSNQLVTTDDSWLSSVTRTQWAVHITITRCGHWPGQEQRGERGEEPECEHMSVDFVYPPMVTPELIILNLGPSKLLQTHGCKRVKNVDLLRARMRSLDLSWNFPKIMQNPRAHVRAKPIV